MPALIASGFSGPSLYDGGQVRVSDNVAASQTSRVARSQENSPGYDPPGLSCLANTREILVRFLYELVAKRIAPVSRVASD